MNLIEVDLERIRPNLRLLYHKDTLEMLCHFIRCHGECDPMEVWFDGECFRIWDGEKRWRVCRMLGIRRVKVILLEFD